MLIKIFFSITKDLKKNLKKLIVILGFHSFIFFNNFFFLKKNKVF
jgi:hypothetical protein